MSHTNKSYEDIEKALKYGYLAMSEINLEEAETGLESDSESLRICEENLRSVNKSDS